jgi:hypothetical protein
MIVLRSFSSKSNNKRKDSNHGQWVDEEGRHHSAYRSLASAMKAGGATLGAGAAVGGTLGALAGGGGGYLVGRSVDEGRNAYKSRKAIKQALMEGVEDAAAAASKKAPKGGRVTGTLLGATGGGTYGAYKGAKKALIPAAILGTGYGLYRYGRGYKPKKDKKDKK